MSSAIPNIWHLRTVAETSSKACYICKKPTTRVLITPNNKDFFYTCQNHLDDRGFASPIVDPKAEAAKQKKAAMDQEIEKVKQEYEAKQKNKKKKKSKEDEDGKAEKERDEKIKSIQDGQAGEKAAGDDMPRIYALQRNIYQMRLDRQKTIEMDRRNQQRMKDPAFFPSAPTTDFS